MWYIFVIGGVVLVLTVILSISYICSLYGMCCVCYCFTAAKEADKANQNNALKENKDKGNQSEVSNNAGVTAVDSNVKDTISQHSASSKHAVAYESQLINQRNKETSIQEDLSDSGMTPMTLLNLNGLTREEDLTYVDHNDIELQNREAPLTAKRGYHRRHAQKLSTDFLIP